MHVLHNNLEHYLQGQRGNKSHLNPSSLWEPVFTLGQNKLALIFLCYVLIPVGLPY